MTTAGDPTFPPALMPYDFAGLAGAVDFMAPEGYGRIGDWNRVRTGLFTVAYARAVAPALPVVWAEYGNSTWDQEKGCVNPDQVRVVEQYYRDFFQMAYQSGANGTIAWWYPGGYRCGERSDYGIIGPDGERRPQAKVFQEWAERMKTPRPLPKADVIIPIKLENDVDGVAGIYRRVEAEYWKAVDAGKTPGLKVVPADSTIPDRKDRTAPTR
jgi:hypothetical protein